MKKKDELIVGLSGGKNVTLVKYPVEVRFPNGETISVDCYKDKNAKKPDYVAVEANRRQLRCYGEKSKEELQVGNIAKFNQKYGIKA